MGGWFMPTQNRNTPSKPVALHRRAMLRYSVTGGAALAAAAIGIGNEGPVEAAQTPTTPPAPAKTMRRIVTAHNREGKSYIAIDELVPVNSIWSTSAEQPLGAPPAGEKALVSRVTG